MNKSLVLAIVGMPGAGKSEVVSYLVKKNIPAIRFGEITEEKLKELQLSVTPENEQKIREALRKEFGMAVFAVKSLPQIQSLLQKHPVVVIDGLYSWEEYTFLKEQISHRIVIHVFARPEIRYARLAKRQVRPFTTEQAKLRDIAEIERLNKGGPIAIADYIVENDSDLESLHDNIDKLLKKL